VDLRFVPILITW